MRTVRSSATETVIDLRSSRAVPVLACIFTLGVGAIGVYAGVTDHITPHTMGVRVAAVVIGGCFLLVCGVVGACIPAMLRARRLVIDHTGVRHEDPTGSGFSVGWPELESIWVSQNIKLALGPLSWATPRSMRPTPLRLVMVPADAAFEERHPDLVDLRRGSHRRYVFPLGPDRLVVPVLDAALLRFAGERYTGVVVDHNPIAQT